LRENYHLKIQTFGRHTTVSFKPFKIQINSKVGFYFREKDIMTARVLADHLFFIRRPFYGKRYESQIALFGPIAAQYRALKIKPTVSEEQRKYIVQANSLNQQKEYGKAIELYSKAIDLDQTAYPAAYSNIALLSAQVRKFDAAIYYMKKYLLLEPDASDARGAQDKIYEWEAGINK
jgi:tetratricopeptide (TPR) repeat protein